MIFLLKQEFLNLKLLTIDSILDWALENIKELNEIKKLEEKQNE